MSESTTHRPVDKIFAENLGQSYGGCVRDLANTLFNREVAEAAGIKLCPIPLLGGYEKRRMRAFWAANLQAIALWITLERMPEFGDENSFARPYSICKGSWIKPWGVRSFPN